MLPRRGEGGGDGDVDDGEEGEVGDDADEEGEDGVEDEDEDEERGVFCLLLLDATVEALDEFLPLKGKEAK